MSRDCMVGLSIVSKGALARFPVTFYLSRLSRLVAYVENICLAQKRNDHVS